MRGQQHPSEDAIYFRYYACTIFGKFINIMPEINLRKVFFAATVRAIQETKKEMR